MEKKSAKYGLFGAIVAALITGAIGLYIHYDGKSEQKRILEMKQQTDESEDTARLTITDVYLPPINTSIDSVFFAEISNNSYNVAENITVKLDFGEATVSQCEILPDIEFNKDESLQRSIISFSVDRLEREDSFYIYCLISHPVFRTLLITGSNLFSNETLSFDNYKIAKSTEESGYVTFFKVIGSVVILIFVTYFVVISITMLNRKFKF